MDKKVSHPCKQIVLALAVLLSVPLFSLQIIYAQEPTWTQGQLVGLRAGTCIREGPGLTYRAHTRVPEDDWVVMVIDGPRTVSGKAWFDTSRNAAGDPSGGTGWVMADQTDAACDSPAQVGAPVAPVQGNKPITPSPVLPDLTEVMNQAQTWWARQPTTMKWLVAVALLVVLIVIWRSVSSTALAILRVLVFSLLLWWLMDWLRPIWEGPWHRIAGDDGPDLALLVALVPLVAWLVSLVRRR